MKIQSLISADLPSLAPNDAVEDALSQLMEYSVRHLPVVDAGQMLLGLVSEDQLLEAGDPDTEIRMLLGRKPISVRPSDHVFDVTKVMVQHDLTTAPVTDEEGRYLGAVRRYDLFNQFARMLATQEAGAILALEIDPRDYSLGKLVHLIEQSAAKVLSVASEPPATAEGPRRVTVKLNTTDATRARHMLEHNGYRIVASFGEEDSALLERVQEFMRYLEV